MWKILPLYELKLIKFYLANTGKLRSIKCFLLEIIVHKLIKELCSPSKWKKVISELRVFSELLFQ